MTPLPTYTAARPAWRLTVCTSFKAVGLPVDEPLTRDVPVDLRITVDPAGYVADVEQASRGADKQLVRLAEDAARNWQFVPARRNDESVSSELILHFMFKGPASAEP